MIRTGRVGHASCAPASRSAISPTVAARLPRRVIFPGMAVSGRLGDGAVLEQAAAADAAHIDAHAAKPGPERGLVRGDDGLPALRLDPLDLVHRQQVGAADEDGVASGDGGLVVQHQGRRLLGGNGADVLARRAAEAVEGDDIQAVMPAEGEMVCAPTFRLSSVMST